MTPIRHFHSLLLTGIYGDEESRQRFGVLTSPNYPQLYPNNHDSTQTIRVAEGKKIWIKFTNFDTEREYDFVRVTGDDGTDFTHWLTADEGTGLWGNNVQSPHLSNRIDSNIVHVHFHTDGNTQRTGWRLEWSV